MSRPLDACWCSIWARLSGPVLRPLARLHGARVLKIESPEGDIVRAVSESSPTRS